MFNHFDRFDLFRFKPSTNNYNPYINYSWSQTLTVDGNKQIKDTGTAGLNLQLYYGQGVKFNGVNQGIADINLTGFNGNYTILIDLLDVSENTKQYLLLLGDNIIWKTGSLLRFYDGSKDIELGSYPAGKIGKVAITRNGLNYSVYIDGILKATNSGGSILDSPKLSIGADIATAFSNSILGNVVISKDVLTQEQIQHYSNNPETFIYRENNELKSDCGLDISKIVAWFPMCEKDGYIRDEKNYTVGTNFEGISMASATGGSGNTKSGNINKFTFNNITSTGATYLPNVKFTPNVFDTSLYFVEIEVKCLTGTMYVARIESIPTLHINKVLNAGQSETFTHICKFANISGQKGSIIINGVSHPTFSAEVIIKSVSKITNGIYPILNYTTTARTLAQRLSYGLQTCFLNRDVNGRYLSISRKEIQNDSIGYADTKWIPKENEDWSIEVICKHDNTTLSTATIFGTDGIGVNDKVRASIFYNSTTSSRRPGITIADQLILQGDSLIPPDVYLITVSYNSAAKRFSYYLNEELIGFRDVPTFINNLNLPLKLNRISSYKEGNTPIRLFKVHKKVLTQEEVTKNFNEYQSQGLLNG